MWNEEKLGLISTNIFADKDPQEYFIKSFLNLQLDFVSSPS